MSVSCNSPYNKFTYIRGMIYKILSEVLINNEEIWKLLKYPDSGALQESDLTTQEKRELIYSGVGDASDFRVFRSSFIEDGFDEEVTQLRMYISRLTPDFHTNGTVDFVIEILCHNKLLYLDEYENRLEVLLQQILETLNGIEVDGLGKLFFNKDARSTNQSILNLYNNKNFSGHTIIMSTRTA